MESAVLSVSTFIRRWFEGTGFFDLNASKNFEELGQYLEDVDKHLEEKRNGPIERVLYERIVLVIILQSKHHGTPFLETRIGYFFPC